MADTGKTEETGLEDKSIAPAGTNSAPPQPIPTPVSVSPAASEIESEAHVLEETITRAAPKPPSPPSVEKALASVPSPAPAPTAASPTIPPGPVIQNTDIAKILEKVKLPERRISEKTADTKTPPSAIQPTAAPSATSDEALPPRSAGEKQRDVVSPVHTLKNDLQSVVHDQKISLVRAVSLEEDRRVHEKTEPEETPATARQSKRVSAIVFSVALLCFLGSAALFAVYTLMRERTNTPIAQIDSSILFAEQSVLLPLNDYPSRDLKRTLAEARASSAGTLGSITRIIPVIALTNPDGMVQNTPASFSEFARAIGAHPPDELVRALGDDFFFGIHTVDENAPLIIVPVVSYDHAFAGMLGWEDALNADLAPAFTAVPNLITDPNGIPSKRTFQDLVMRNYDVRALKDDAGEIQLYYSFPSQRMLVIAESPYSFTEILSRLQAGQKL